MIEGPSGSGKTSLALGLLEQAEWQGLPAFLVADDQARLTANNGVLEAIVPETIAGMAELRGFGIIRKPHKQKTTIQLCARLIEDEAIERMPDEKTCLTKGVTVRLAEVPQRHERAAIRIILAQLGLIGNA